MTEDCYDQDVRKSLDKKGWSKCQNWYYMTGVYKGDCDNLNCIEMIKCCRMRPPGTQAQTLVQQWSVSVKGVKRENRKVLEMLCVNKGPSNFKV